MIDRIEHLREINGCWADLEAEVTGVRRCSECGMMIPAYDAEGGSQHTCPECLEDIEIMRRRQDQIEAEAEHWYRMRKEEEEER